MLYGGSRSGKTSIIIYSLIVRACKETSRHVVLRKNFNAVKRSIFLDTFPKIKRMAFSELSLQVNKSDYYIKFPNESEIWFGGLDDGEKSDKILGNEYSSIFFSECSQIDYESITVAKSRLAEKNGLRKKAYYDMNPPKKSHWSYWLFERGLNPIDETPLSNSGDYASMLMNPQDNIENIDENYIRLLEAMPEDQKRRFLLGEFSDESDGQVYYAFRRDEHVSEDLKLLPGSIFIGMDFNVHPMTAVIGQVQDGRLVVLDERYLENSDTYKMCDSLKSDARYVGATVVPDSTGRNRKTSGQSDFKILTDAGFTIPSVFNPFVGDRVNNVNRLLSDGKVLIHPRCKKLINDLEKVSWKNNQLDQSGANKMLTHISDALGYALWHLMPISPQLKRGGSITGR